ncbi:MAG: NAD(P)/FAD-dependent oxidoreductase [Lachnospiraceae bacterium]|nr:NAD(P)/FAD-dependent oxidoreductase [Lachnospiraceae bacterium]
MKDYDVIIIGAGAAGLMAAVSAAKENASVLVIEHLNKLGKKILSTGNGKCNYTNRNQGVEFYRGSDPDFVLSSFEQMSQWDTISFFKELGIYPKEKNGYFYPYNEQATSVVEVFEMAVKNYGVNVLLECDLISVKKEKTFKITTTKGNFTGKNLIFACGLRAGRKTGNDGSAFQYIENFGHHFIDIVPALVQMKSNESFLKNLAGIRAETELKILINDREVFKDHGELLHIDGGISGIVAFQGSRYAAYGVLYNKKVKAVIDYFPKESFRTLYEELELRFHTLGKNKTALEAMIGFFPHKLVLSWYQRLNIDFKKPASSLSGKQLKELANIIKATELKITGTKEFESAQVCAGGVSTKEVNETTMESKIVPGLYFAGEVLDIDGMCGGFNLQWAWSSGYVAGHSAATKEK